MAKIILFYNYYNVQSYSGIIIKNNIIYTRQLLIVELLKKPQQQTKPKILKQSIPVSFQLKYLVKDKGYRSKRFGGFIFLVNVASILEQVWISGRGWSWRELFLVWDLRKEKCPSLPSWITVLLLGQDWQ